MLLWIPATLAASVLQVARNALQRGLLPKSGPWAATLVRFLFGLPFSLVAAAGLALVTPGAAVHLTHAFWLNVLTGAFTQVLATACLLVAMRRAGFAVGTSMQQSSLPLAAILGLIVFHDQLTTVAWIGVALTSAALLTLTWPRQTLSGRTLSGQTHSGMGASGPQPVSGGVFGLLSGLCFGYSLNAYRQAGLAMDPHHPLFAAAATVTVSQSAQSLGLGLLLAVWDRPALRSVFAAWRQSLTAGFCGAMASICWLLALGLAPAAPVRALGVVEAPVAAFAGRRVFQEKLSLVQWIAGAAVALGVAMTALG